MELDEDYLKEARKERYVGLLLTNAGIRCAHLPLVYLTFEMEI